MSTEAHKAAGKAISARCAVITLSDTRNEETDKSGAFIKQALTDAGHHVVFYRVIPDDPEQLGALLCECLEDANVDAVLTNGGTGVSRRDQTIAAIERQLDAPLPGFGELFRMLSYEEIGSAAILSRAVGGIAHDKPLFAMPGSTGAVRLAMTKLILPELGHLLGELRK
jgi:molybdenum cofactor biosynthesis protein B